MLKCYVLGICVLCTTVLASKPLWRNINSINKSEYLKRSPAIGIQNYLSAEEHFGTGIHKRQALLNKVSVPTYTTKRQGKRPPIYIVYKKVSPDGKSPHYIILTNSSKSSTPLHSAYSRPKAPIPKPNYFPYYPGKHFSKPNQVVSQQTVRPIKNTPSRPQVLFVPPSKPEVLSHAVPEVNTHATNEPIQKPLGHISHGIWYPDPENEVSTRPQLNDVIQTIPPSTEDSMTVGTQSTQTSFTEQSSQSLNEVINHDVAQILNEPTASSVSELKNEITENSSSLSESNLNGLVMESNLNGSNDAFHENNMQIVMNENATPMSTTFGLANTSEILWPIEASTTQLVLIMESSTASYQEEAKTAVQNVFQDGEMSTPVTVMTDHEELANIENLSTLAPVSLVDLESTLSMMETTEITLSSQPQDLNSEINDEKETLVLENTSTPMWHTNKPEIMNEETPSPEIIYEIEEVTSIKPFDQQPTNEAITVIPFVPVNDMWHTHQPEVMNDENSSSQPVKHAEEGTSMRPFEEQLPTITSTDMSHSNQPEIIIVDTSASQVIHEPEEVTSARPFEPSEIVHPTNMLNIAEPSNDMWLTNESVPINDETDEPVHETEERNFTNIDETLQQTIIEPYPPMLFEEQNQQGDQYNDIWFPSELPKMRAKKNAFEDDEAEVHMLVLNPVDQSGEVYLVPLPPSALPIPIDDSRITDSVCLKSSIRYAVGEECDVYIECKDSRAQKYLCPDGLVFNANVELDKNPCRYPKDVSCEGRIGLQNAQPTSNCPHKYGYFRIDDPASCSKYRVCNDGFAYDFTCPAGLVFDSKTYRCEWAANAMECRYSIMNHEEISVKPLSLDVPRSIEVKKEKLFESPHDKNLPPTESKEFDMDNSVQHEPTSMKPSSNRTLVIDLSSPSRLHGVQPHQSSNALKENFASDDSFVPSLQNNSSTPINRNEPTLNSLDYLSTNTLMKTSQEVKPLWMVTRNISGSTETTKKARVSPRDKTVTERKLYDSEEKTVNQQKPISYAPNINNRRYVYHIPAGAQIINNDENNGAPQFWLSSSEPPARDEIRSQKSTSRSTENNLPEWQNQHSLNSSSSVKEILNATRSDEVNLHSLNSFEINKESRSPIPSDSSQHDLPTPIYDQSTYSVINSSPTSYITTVSPSEISFPSTSYIVDVQPTKSLQNTNQENSLHRSKYSVDVPGRLPSINNEQVTKTVLKSNLVSPSSVQIAQPSSSYSKVDHIQNNQHESVITTSNLDVKDENHASTVNGIASNVVDRKLNTSDANNKQSSSEKILIPAKSQFQYTQNKITIGDTVILPIKVRSPKSEDVSQVPVNAVPQPITVFNYSDAICGYDPARFAIEGECDTYVECRNKKAEKFLCPDGLFFSPDAPIDDYPCWYPKDISCNGRKVMQRSLATPDCPHQFGYYRISDPKNCGRFRMCNGGIGYDFTCPDGLAYNEESYRCEWADQVKNCNTEDYIGFKCPEIPKDEYADLALQNFLFRNPTDCTKFYLCISGVPRVLSCDEGKAFDEELNRCVPLNQVAECRTLSS